MLHESRCCDVHEVVWERGVHASTLCAITLCVPCALQHASQYMNV